MLSAWYSQGKDWTTPALDFGTLAHEVYAEILRSCVRTRESQIPTQEGVEILREIAEKSPIVLPFDRDYGMEQLRWQVIRFCDHEWPTGMDNGPQVFAVEERMFLEVPCPDGKLRVVTGQPDALVSDPPKGVVVIDFKTGMSKPPEPRDGDLTKEDGKKHLSSQGLFQLYVYGAMILTNWPGLDYVVLKEFHTRWNKIRAAKLYREDLEHILWDLGHLVQKVDTALMEGEGSELLRASPGSHCAYCPGKFKCPVPYDQRGEGSIVDDNMALEYAKRWVRSDTAKIDVDKSLKAFIEAGGTPPILDDGTYVGWKTTANSRRFGVHSA